eukprot:TRINITY_DN10290_c0_g1_i1.p1 TRINITY_DN10290_c0_g1~~TRINITY_DN10290_c0_g1_i1.p1  ORF type:complete len:851 (+),score=124.76 TRINITY_DN10290_c0_g1_i1:32-2554(+)
MNKKEQKSNSADNNQNLLQQKLKLLNQYEAQKRQIAQLTQQVTAFENKKAEYQQTLLCIQRLWVGLLQDISTLCKDTPKKEDWEKGEEGEDKLLPEYQQQMNPFLARLLSIKVAGQEVSTESDNLTKGNEQDEVAFIEKKLKALIKKTLEQLQRVVDYVQDYDRKRMNMKVKGYMTESQREELREETDEMRQKVEKLQSLCKQSKQHADDLSGKCVDSFKRIREVENNLENVRQELLGATRKLWKLERKQALANQGANNSEAGAKEGEDKKEDDGELSTIIQEKLQKQIGMLSEQYQQLYETEKQIEEIDAKLDQEHDIEEHQELKEMSENLKSIQKEQESLHLQLIGMQREAASIKYQEHGHRLRVEEVELLKVEADQIRDICRKKEEEIRDLKGRIWEMQGDLRNLRDASMDERSVGHWKKIYAQLEMQNKAAVEKLNRMEDRKQKAKEAELQWMEAECLMEKERMENDRLRSYLADTDSRFSTYRFRKRKFENRIRELETFAAVTMRLGGVDAAKVAQTRSSAAQYALLHKLQRQDEGVDIIERKREVDQLEQSIGREIKALEQESQDSQNEVEKLKKEIEVIKQQLEESLNECECFLNELEVTMKGYEGTITENKELCKQLEQKEEEINTLKSERDKANFERLEHEIELKQAQFTQQKATEQKVQIQEQCTSLKTAIQGQQQEYAACSQVIQSLQEELKTLKAECDQTEQSITEKDEEIEALKLEAKELDEQLEQEEKQLAQERIQGIKVQEENNVLRRSLGNNATLLLSGRSAAELFKQLRCSVCNVREKDTIITRCYHTFCRECLNKLGENRQRRCPRCKEVFLTSELRPFELD